jgi:hypothetical protein
LTDGPPAVAGGGTGARPAEATSVAILADDLIWATRLADAVAAAGGEPIRVRRLPDLVVRLEGDAVHHAMIDLTARAYDGVVAITAAVGAGAQVVAVGQHDDVPLRQAALAAGAERVYTYRALFEGGPRLLAVWLAR